MIKHTKVKWLVLSLASVEENNHHVLIVINRLKEIYVKQTFPQNADIE
jgi:hypothetical protein